MVTKSYKQRQEASPCFTDPPQSSRTPQGYRPTKQSQPNDGTSHRIPTSQ